MFDTFFLIKSLAKALFMIIKSLVFVFIPLILAFIIILISCFIFYVKHRYIENIKPISSNFKRQKQPGFFRTIFVDFPKQLTYDLLEQDPNDFQDFGVHMVVGEQGSGKTMTVVYLLQKWQKEYQKLQVYTNMCYKYENGSLEHWKQLIDRNNGKFGVVNVIDEIKTWWSNRDSKDVPPEILGEICQQRKQKKAIVGTVQVFSELAKPLRDQTHFVYIPKTFLGCLTFVRISKKKYYDAENDTFKKYTGFFIFAHNKHLRNAYDTYKKIEKYKDIDFAQSSAFTSGATNSQTCE